MTHLKFIQPGGISSGVSKHNSTEFVEAVLKKRKNKMSLSPVWRKAWCHFHSRLSWLPHRLFFLVYALVCWSGASFHFCFLYWLYSEYRFVYVKWLPVPPLSLQYSVCNFLPHYPKAAISITIKSCWLVTQFLFIFPPNIPTYTDFILLYFHLSTETDSHTRLGFSETGLYTCWQLPVVTVKSHWCIPREWSVTPSVARETRLFHNQLVIAVVGRCWQLWAKNLLQRGIKCCTEKKYPAVTCCLHRRHQLVHKHSPTTPLSSSEMCNANWKSRGFAIKTKVAAFEIYCWEQ